MKRLGRILDRSLQECRWLPALFTRAALGWVFMEAGLGKLKNLTPVIEYFVELGIPLAKVQAPFVAVAELTAGALLILGGATRFANAILMTLMTVAILTAKRSEIETLSDLFGLSEFLMILLLGWLLTHGAGAVSLDAWRQKNSTT